ncbi:type IV fimbrial biogenesis PilY1-like protein, partial [mine drainage metagenome]
MSPAGGFAFTNTQVAGNRYVINPCFGYPTASSNVNSDCSYSSGGIAKEYGPTTLASSQYMQIGASSDDPNINDVLYMQGSSNLPVFITYNGPSPPNPYTAYTLTDYNTNLSSIKSSYLSTYPNIGGWSTYPTNAGYIPFS